MDENKRAHVCVSGDVQGVYYRASALKEAERLGLSGWVRNLRDGRVELVFEGPFENVLEMVKWCSIGPEYARVTRIEADYSEANGEFSCFQVIH